MVFEKSFHYPSVAAWRGSNHGSGTVNPLSILERGQKKWEIVKTVLFWDKIHLPEIMWIDKYGKYVWYEIPSYHGTDFPVVGEFVKVDAPLRRIEDDMIETGEPIIEEVIQNEEEN